MITQRTATSPQTARGYHPIVAVLHDPVPSADPTNPENVEKLTPSWVFISQRASTTRLILRRPTLSGELEA